MTGYLTIDSSFAFNLLSFNTKQEAYKKAFNTSQQRGLKLCAPTLWIYELTSTFSKCERFGEITHSEAKAGLKLALTLNVELIQPTQVIIQRAYEWTRALNRAAAYDCFYLALAESLDCEFWTADKRLVNATNVAWVKLIA